jgi:hypothetical protein
VCVCFWVIVVIDTTTTNTTTSQGYLYEDC